MTNLSKWTLSNIEFWEIKSLLKENKDFFWSKDFIRDYVNQVLAEENKDKVDNNDFDLMNSYIENINEYQKVLKNIFPNKNFSIKLVEKIIFWNSLEQFKKALYNTPDLKDIFRFSNEEKIFFIIDIYNIKTLYEFEKILKKYRLKTFLMFSNEKNFENIVKKYNIKTAEQFEKIFLNENTRYVLIYGNEKNLENIIKICKILEQFETFCNIKELRDDFESSKEEDFELITKICKTLEDFEKFYNNLFSVPFWYSSIWIDLFDKLINHNYENIYDVFKDEIKKYLQTLDISSLKTDTNITKDKTLLIYLRYWNTVDYPEIAELIIYFLQELIKLGLINSVKDLKIIPRNLERIPWIEFFENIDWNIEILERKWLKFREEINKKQNITFYLSHSTNEIKSNIHISSWWMCSGSNSISTFIELEEKFDVFYTDKRTIEELFNELISIIKFLNHKIIEQN